MIAVPPPQPALVWVLEAQPGYPAWQRLGVMVECTGWTSSVGGLFVRRSNVGAMTQLLQRERRTIASGRFGFRTQADRCNQKQADGALKHATSALRAMGIG